jgi:hypothetical protein
MIRRCRRVAGEGRTLRRVVGTVVERDKDVEAAVVVEVGHERRLAPTAQTEVGEGCVFAKRSVADVEKDPRVVARIAGALAVRNLKNVVETVPVEVGDTKGLGRILHRELIDRPEADIGTRQRGDGAIGVLDRRDHLGLAVVVEVTNIGKVRRHRLTVRADRFELDRRNRDLCSGRIRHGK